MDGLWTRVAEFAVVLPCCIIIITSNLDMPSRLNVFELLIIAWRLLLDASELEYSIMICL